MKEITLISYFPVQLRQELQKLDWNKVEEIRIRVGQPVETLCATDWNRGRIPVSTDMLYEMLNYLSGYSLFAMEEEMKQGYFTIAGGHRIGLCGHISFHEKEGKKTPDFLSDISGLNIRVAHEVKGCALPLMPYIRNKDSIYHTLFFSPPGMGKTTYLRDSIRLLSSGLDGGKSFKIGVVDERSEIGASFCGRVQNDLGGRTDVMDNCPKEFGMRMLLRSMSPEILAVDELGGEEDFLSVLAAVNGGVRILGTVHADSKEEVMEKPYMKDLLKNKSWRLIRIMRTEQGKRQAIVYLQGNNTMEEGIWVNG